MSNTIIAYQFDEQGYFLGETLVQKVEDDYLVPSDTTLEKPKIKEGYWSKWNGSKWVNEKIPSTCAEAISLNYSCISNNPDFHNQEVKNILESLVANESEDYRIKVDENFIMSIEAIPEPTVDELKQKKLEELGTISGQYDQYKCDSIYIIHSDDVKYNADIRSQTNMQGLVDVMDETATTLYKDFDNQFHTVTREDLISLKSNCIANGQALYQQKWAYQQRIYAATTKAEIEAIIIEFEMMDFTKE